MPGGAIATNEHITAAAGSGQAQAGRLCMVRAKAAKPGYTYEYQT